MRSEAKTVKDYLSELPEPHREGIEAVRDVILKNLPAGYEEAMNWGMITYQVPLKVYPDTYNKQPLMFAALASQKHHMAVYLMGIYLSDSDRDAFFEAYKKTGKRLDIGKSCVRFRKLDDLPLELVGQAIASMSMEDYIDRVKAAQTGRTSR